MIIDPFMPPRLRVRKYNIYVAAITLGMVLFYALVFFFGGTTFVNETNANLIVIFFVYVAENLINIFIMLRIMCLLHRQGMSPNTMK